MPPDPFDIIKKLRSVFGSRPVFDEQDPQQEIGRQGSPVTLAIADALTSFGFGASAGQAQQQGRAQRIADIRQRSLQRSQLETQKTQQESVERQRELQGVSTLTNILGKSAKGGEVRIGERTLTIPGVEAKAKQQVETAAETAFRQKTASEAANLAIIENKLTLTGLEKGTPEYNQAFAKALGIEQDVSFLEIASGLGIDTKGLPDIQMSPQSAATFTRGIIQAREGFAARKALVAQARKPGKLSPSIQTTLRESIKLQSSLKKVQNIFNENRDLVGPLVGRFSEFKLDAPRAIQTILGGPPPEEFIEIATRLQSATNILLKIRSGAQVTDQEFVRLGKELALITNNPEVFAIRLSIIMEDLEANIRLVQIMNQPSLLGVPIGGGGGSIFGSGLQSLISTLPEGL